MEAENSVFTLLFGDRRSFTSIFRFPFDNSELILWWWWGWGWWGVIWAVFLAPRWAAEAQRTGFGSELITTMETDGRAASKWRRARLMLHGGQLLGCHRPSPSANSSCRFRRDVKRSWNVPRLLGGTDARAHAPTVGAGGGTLNVDLDEGSLYAAAVMELLTTAAADSAPSSRLLSWFPPPLRLPLFNKHSNRYWKWHRRFYYGVRHVAAVLWLPQDWS